MKRLQKEHIKPCHNYNNNGEIILNILILNLQQKNSKSDFNVFIKYNFIYRRFKFWKMRGRVHESSMTMVSLWDMIAFSLRRYLYDVKLAKKNGVYLFRIRFVESFV